MIEQLIAEATECDFKVALEIKKPKSWLKSVSSFSNGIGGTLFFGISDDRKPIGLSDVQKDAEAISRLIKERITPLPQFILKPLQEDGKNLLALEVSPGRSTPYYYKADGVMEAYIRVGNESVIAPDYIVNELILKGTNQSFDTLTTDAVKKDYSFTLLKRQHKNDRCSYNHQQAFQNLHSSSSLQHSRYRLHRASASLTSSSVNSRLPLVSSIST